METIPEVPVNLTRLEEEEVDERLDNENELEIIIHGLERRCCEDCPHINSHPPSESDCPNFAIEKGEPICLRPDSLDMEIEQLSSSTKTD